jgi:hypothetical protein
MQPDPTDTDRPATMEEVAALRFAGWPNVTPEVLDSLAPLGRHDPTFRCGFMSLKFSDEELAEMVRESPDAFLDLLACCVEAKERYESALKTISCIQARLFTVTARVIEIEQQ